MPTSRSRRRRIKQQKRFLTKKSMANTQRNPQRSSGSAPVRHNTRNRNRVMTSPYQSSVSRHWADESGSHQFDPDPTGWFDLMSIDLPCLHTLCQLCTNGIKQSLNFTKEMLFPSIRYKRELQVTMERLEAVERELQTLKHDKTPVYSTPKPSPYCCLCVGQSQLTTTSAQYQSPSTLATGQPPPPVAPPPPPPPLPPPPPPPLPPPVFKPSGPLKIVKKKDKSSDNTRSEARALVTLKDIQNIKLRKVDVQTGTALNKTPGQAVVTTADLAGISLRKMATTSLKTTPDVRDSISQEVLQFHSKLRKVDVKRSPGGTPINKKRRRDSGNGLTPMMTRALKKKFLFALSRSPSPATVQDKENGTRESSREDLRGKELDTMELS